MKKLTSALAIAAIALTSVFSFTSCNKENDSIHQVLTTKTVVVQDGRTTVKVDTLNRPNKAKVARPYSVDTARILR